MPDSNTQLIHSPGPALTGVGATGEVTLTNPSTGDSVALSDATVDQLADYKLAVAEWQDAAKAAQQMADGEILRRMDKQAKWTIHTPFGILTGRSPADVRTIDDPQGLRDALLELEAQGLLSTEAVEAAISQPPPKPQPLKVAVSGIDALLKIGGQVAETVERFSRMVPPDRKVTRK